MVEDNAPYFHEKAFQAVVLNENAAFEIETHPSRLVLFFKLAELYEGNEYILHRPATALIAYKKTGQIYWECDLLQTAKAQTPAGPTPEPEEALEGPIVETPASFPVGNAALFQFIAENLKNPAIAREQGI